MEPTNVLIRVCILLLMQPAPLAGTATKLDNQHLSWLQDATRTPRGDGNLDIQASTISVWLDATRTPRGDGNVRPVWIADHGIISRCNLRPPYGDGNFRALW